MIMSLCLLSAIHPHNAAHSSQSSVSLHLSHQLSRLIVPEHSQSSLIPFARMTFANTCRHGNDGVLFSLYWFLHCVYVCVCVFAEAQKRLCHPECTDDGCWGAGDDQCLACAHYRHGQRCLASCQQETGLYLFANGTAELPAGMCGRCHPECIGNCRGPVSMNYHNLFREIHRSLDDVIESSLRHCASTCDVMTSV